MSLKVFNFICSNGHSFEAMVASLEDFEAQKKQGLFRCPICDDPDISRLLSAPHVKTGNTTAAPDEMTHNDILNGVYGAVKKIMDESEYVGERFPEEARAIQRGDAESRLITGTASKQEVEDLREEGIDVFPLPLLKNKGEVN